MSWIRTLRRDHRRVWFGLWVLALVGVVGGVQWWVAGGGDPIRTEVLGASQSIPRAPVLTAGPAEGQLVSSTSVTFGYSNTQNGVGFQCKLDDAAFASCGKGGVTYSGLPAGSHKFQVEAQQGSGPWSSPAIRNWTVVLPPPTPTITSTPPSSTIQPDATFAFTDTQSTVAFQCKLDGADYAPCTSPAIYEGLAAGSHTFSVQAVNGPATSAAASFTWTVQSASFGISGDITQPLWPGRTVPLNLVFTNPYNSARGLTVTGVTVTVQHGTTGSSGVCDGPTNVTVAPAALGYQAPWPLRVLRSSSPQSLQQLGVPQNQWPQVTMQDLPTNQDACKGATFHFTYTGTATNQ